MTDMDPSPNQLSPQPTTLLSLSEFAQKNFTNVSFDFRHFPGLIGALNTERLFLFKLDKLIAIVQTLQLTTLLIFLLCYLFLIQWLQQRFMSTRLAISIPPIVAIWNLSLSMLSILGAIRMLPELIYMIENYGLKLSILDNRYTDDPRYFLWAFLFLPLKLLDMMDFIVMVLRKESIPWALWLYQIMTICYSFQLLVQESIPGDYRWLATSNYLLHACVHLYRSATIIRTNSMSHPLFMVITILQLIHIIIVLAVETMVILSGQQISLHYTNSTNLVTSNQLINKIGLTIYSLLLVLFIRYFWQNFCPISKERQNHRHPKEE